MKVIWVLCFHPSWNMEMGVLLPIPQHTNRVPSRLFRLSCNSWEYSSLLEHYVNVLLSALNWFAWA